MIGDKEGGPDVHVAHEFFVFPKIHIKAPKVVLPQKFGHVNSGISKMFPVVRMKFAKYSSKPTIVPVNTSQHIELGSFDIYDHQVHRGKRMFFQEAGKWHRFYRERRRVDRFHDSALVLIVRELKNARLFHNCDAFACYGIVKIIFPNIFSKNRECRWIWLDRNDGALLLFVPACRGELHTLRDAPRYR